jgi:hypothetical protein
VTNDAGGDEDLAASELSKVELVVHRLAFRLESEVKLSTKAAVPLAGSNQIPSNEGLDDELALVVNWAVNWGELLVVQAGFASKGGGGEGGGRLVQNRPVDFSPVSGAPLVVTPIPATRMVPAKLLLFKIICEVILPAVGEPTESVVKLLSERSPGPTSTSSGGPGVGMAPEGSPIYDWPVKDGRSDWDRE